MTIKKCEQCKKEFKRWGKPRKNKGGYRFCGKQCYWDSMKMKKINVCETCGKEFITKSHVLKTKRCSRECMFKNEEFLQKQREKQLGIEAWNKGKPAPWARYDLLMTKEAREKSRLAKLGKPSPNKGKAFLHLRGENNPNWKGGIGTERHKAMGKIEYKLWRNAIFERDDYTCVMCKSKSGYLHADHIKSWKEYPDLRYAIDNGRTLCEACHYFVTFGKIIPKGIKWGRLKEVKKDVS